MKTVVIRDCPDEFADLIYDLDKAFRSRIKMGITLHLSGSASDFKCVIEKVEGKTFFALLGEKENERRSA